MTMETKCINLKLKIKVTETESYIMVVDENDNYVMYDKLSLTYADGLPVLNLTIKGIPIEVSEQEDPPLSNCCEQATQNEYTWKSQRPGHLGGDTKSQVVKLGWEEPIVEK